MLTLWISHNLFSCTLEFAVAAPMLITGGRVENRIIHVKEHFGFFFDSFLAKVTEGIFWDVAYVHEQVPNWCVYSVPPPHFQHLFPIIASIVSLLKLFSLAVQLWPLIRSWYLFVPTPTTTTILSCPSLFEVHHHPVGSCSVKPR